MFTKKLRATAVAIAALVSLPMFAVGDWDSVATISADDDATQFAQTSYVYFEKPTNWGTPYCYLWNNDNEKNHDWPGEAMTEIADGLWRLGYNFNATMVIFNNNNSDSNKTGDTPLLSGHLYQFTSNGQAATDAGICSDAIPPQLYLVGNFYSEDGKTWLNNPQQMTYDGNGVFTSHCAEFRNLDSPKGYFQFVTSPGVNNWTQVGTVYSALYMDRVITPGELQPFYVDTKAHNSFQCNPGSYTIRVDFNTMQVGITECIPSGIAAVPEEEQLPAEYFTLQGWKLQHAPEVGTLCIERRGDTARVVKM